MADCKSILVIGIGNPYRSDDGIGPHVAEQLRKMLPKEVEVRANVGDGLSLLDLWQKFDCVYLIDAVNAGRTPGQVYRFNALAEQLPRDFFANYSTHTINIPETIALAKDLGSLPGELIIYGVEGKDFRIGPGFSEEARQVLFCVAERIKKEIEKRR